MRKVRTVIEAQVLAHGLVYVNGGHRGLQVRLSPHDMLSAPDFIAAPVVA
jgi:Cys-tRNA(Pro)/Cys-tRNA(Cys) deacylase